MVLKPMVLLDDLTSKPYASILGEEDAIVYHLTSNSNKIATIERKVIGMEERRPRQWHSQLNEDTAWWFWACFLCNFEFVDLETIFR